MKWLIIGGAVFLVLVLIGFLMGPQGGRSITKRDHRMIYDRSQIHDMSKFADFVAASLVSRIRGGLRPSDAMRAEFQEVHTYDLMSDQPVTYAVAVLLHERGLLVRDTSGIRAAHPTEESVRQAIETDPVGHVLRFYSVRQEASNGV